jgi:putative peptidoglycan lipid II flippase
LIVKLIYMRGQFNVASVLVTSQIMKWLALGLWLQILGYVLIKVLNSMGRNRLVAIYTAVGAITNIAINLAAYKLFGAAALGIGATLAWGTITLCCLLTLRLSLIEDSRDLLICAVAVIYAAAAAATTSDSHSSVYGFREVGALALGIAVWTAIFGVLFGKQFKKAVSIRFARRAEPL